MIRGPRISRLRFRAWALLPALAAALNAVPARAAIETDPAALYQTMRRAYDAGVAKGWPFAAQRYYEATVFDAGRSYALFNPSDPQYAGIASIAVRIATQLHYDPLTDENASEWYVRQAAAYVEQHGDATGVAQAQALLAHLDGADQDPRATAAAAQADARAVAHDFRRDPDALVQVIVADVRGYNLTKDAEIRSALLLGRPDELAGVVARKRHRRLADPISARHEPAPEPARFLSVVTTRRVERDARGGQKGAEPAARAVR
jgi:hypothetical protein